MTTRRDVLRRGVGLGLGLAGLSVGCVRRVAGREVVLYSSVDGEILTPLLRRFEAESGVTVRWVGDTEATKTTGLVQRLIAERGRPRADVWWSSEILGTLRLAREGLLAAHAGNESVTWPSEQRGEGGLWYGLALRPRVVVFDTRKQAEGGPPRTVDDLLRPALKGRVGMARAAFGTTRGHLAVLRHTRGEAGYRAWLAGMRAQGVRLYDGNATVVRAVANGEIAAGLTDLDDVLSGQANGWPVACAAPEPSEAGSVVLTPNTVALVKGGPNAVEGGLLIEWLLGPSVERELQTGPWRAVPVRAELRDAESKAWAAAEMKVDWAAAEGVAEAAVVEAG